MTLQLSLTVYARGLHGRPGARFADRWRIIGMVAASRAVKLGGTVATVGFPYVGLQGFAPKLAKRETRLH